MTMSLEEEIKKDPGFRPTRLNSLYLDFSTLKVLNPDGYEANIEAWRALLSRLLKNGSFASSLAIPCTSPNLAQKLSLAKFGKPKALIEVLTVLTQQHDLIPLSEYLLESESYHDLFQDPYIFAYFNPTKWISWSKRYLKGNFKVANNKGELISEEYIFWDHLVESATEIITAVYEEPRSTYSDYLFSMGEFHRILQSKTKNKLSETDFKILLKYYTRDKKYLKVAKSHDGEEIVLIKETLTSSNNLEVLEQDFGIVALKRSIFQAETRKDHLDQKINQLMERLKAITEKSPLNAASTDRLRLVLKLKQILEKSYRTASGTHEQLLKALNLINDATSNATIISQLENSALILDKLNRKVDQKKVDEVISNFEENALETQNISDMIGSIQVEGEDIEDEDIENEFEELLLQMKKEGITNEKKNDKMEEKEIKETKEKQKQEDIENEKLLNKLEKLSVNEEMEIPEQDTRIPITE